MEETYHLGVKALIRNPEGQILLMFVNTKNFIKEKTEGYWDLPGGRVQKGEVVLDTLKREVLEETGLEIDGDVVVTNMGIFLSQIRIPLKSGGEVGLLLSVYECKFKALDVDSIKSSDEHIRIGFFDPREAAELLKVKYPGEFCTIVSNLSNSRNANESEAGN